MARAKKKARRQPEATQPKEQPQGIPAPRTIEPLVPMNARQAQYLRALAGSDQIVTLGPAGTGKTYVASYWAAEQLANGSIERIILSRPAVPAEEEHGFLPGTMGQKIAPWVVPFTEVMEKVLGTARFRSFMNTKVIDIVPLAYMRGRTFDNAVVIIDEAQNTTYNQMKMFLTRIGKNSTVIVNGDIKQSDLAQQSGLRIMLDIIRDQRRPVTVVEFTKADIVRSGVCAMWADAFEMYEEKNGYQDKQAPRHPVVHPGKGVVRSDG